MSEQPQPVFTIEKIYLKDLSLEIPGAPGIFLERETPEIGLQLNNQHETIEDGLFEVLLTVTVTAKLKEEKIMFLVEAQQAGIFKIQNVAEPEVNQVLSIACPNIIFPYLRETVSDVVVRAGFPPVMLNPVNFEALYQQKQQADQQNSSDKSIQ